MGWWDKKIGPAVQAPRPNPNLPRGVGYQPQQPQYAPQYAPQQPLTAEELGYDPNTQVPAGEAMRRWGGTKQAQAEGSCPECGSPRFFSRAQGAKMGPGGMAAPAPECFDCGYPRQQGSVDSVVKVVGGSNASRQGAMLPLAIDKPQASV